MLCGSRVECSQEGCSNSANLQLNSLARIKPEAHQGSIELWEHVGIQTHNGNQYTSTTVRNLEKRTMAEHDKEWWGKQYLNSANLSQISGLSHQISKTEPLKAVLICVCVNLFVYMCLSVTSCQHASQGINIKTVQLGIAKPYSSSLRLVYVSYLLGQSCCRLLDSLSPR